MLKRRVAPKPACWFVPFERNPRFVGRSALLAELEARLAHTGRSKKAAVVGLGGIGKTQIALELAYRTKDKSPSSHVFWVPAVTHDTVRKAFGDIGRQLNVPGLEEPSADVFSLVQQRLSHESAGQWLLIVDNADDAKMWFDPIANDSASSVRLFDYLPRSAQGSILITTRSRKVAVQMAGNEVIVVPDMDEVIASQLLRKALITPVPVDSDETARELLKRLTCLPLAIVQAAAYINANSITLGDYISILGEADDVVVDLLSEHFEDEGRYPEAKNPVAMTWLISFEHIRHHDVLAAEYLSFMACVEPKSIPQSLLPEATSPKKVLDALGTLTAYSFVTKRPDSKCYDMHRLVHLATRNWLAKERQLVYWDGKALTRISHVFPTNNPLNRELWRDYLPHARYALKQVAAGKHDSVSLLLLRRYGHCLFADGRYAEAEAPYQLLVKKLSELEGREHPETLSSMADLAAAYRSQARLTEAEELGVQVLEARKRVLEHDHPSTLTSMADLASTYRRQGRWTEAEGLGMQVVEARKRVLGLEHPKTLTSMAKLASTYRRQGRWTEAEALGVQVLDARKKVLGQEHPDTLTSIENLASTYRRLGRWTEAEALGVRAVEASKRVLGQEHPNTLTSLEKLASTYRRLKRWTEAEGLDEKVLDGRKKVLGQEHPDTLTSMENLASKYRRQGRWTEAEGLGVQVVEAKKRALGQEHPSTLTSLGKLAVTYQRQERWTEAEALGVQVLEARKRELGQEHPATLSSMASLASTYSNQGLWREAEALSVQVVEGSKRMLGREHPETLASIVELASTYRHQGRWTEAEALNEQVLEARKRHKLK